MDKCMVLFILMQVPCRTMSQDYTYLGCFYDSNRREALPDLIYCDRSRHPYETCQNSCGPQSQYCQSQQMTVELCRDICADQNMIYFGLQGGRQCLCGGFFAPYNVLGQPTGQDDSCNQQCIGNSSQTCGADFQASVYQINEPASDCFNPGYVLNGDQSQQDSSFYNAGDVIDFTAVCPPPSIKSGAAPITCTASGTWTDPPPTCTVRCATPTAPMHANFIAGQTLNDSYAVDVEVLFDCDNDPTKTNQVLTCGYYGDWEYTAMDCPVSNTTSSSSTDNIASMSSSPSGVPSSSPSSSTRNYSSTQGPTVAMTSSPGGRGTSIPAVTDGGEGTTVDSGRTQNNDLGLSLVPILSSTLVSLSAIAIFVVIVCLLYRRKRLKHGSSPGITTFGEPVESPGIKDNPTFESSTVHDLRMSDVAGCHGGNDTYIALTTPHDGPTFQLYQTLSKVNSQGDGYEVPVNGANGQTGPELQVHPDTDYEITLEYLDLTNSVVGRNNSRNESPVRGLQVQPETDYETAHAYEYPGIVGGNIPQYESHINGLQESSETPHEYEYMSVL